MVSHTLNPIDRFLPVSTRRYLHGLLPAITVLLVAFGLDEHAVGLWIAAAGAALGLTVAAFNSANAWRTWLYGILVPVQALVVYFGVFTDNQAGAVVALVGTLIGQGAAAAYTPAESKAA